MSSDDEQSATVPPIVEGQLTNLMTYTAFHIGLYVTLSTAFIAVAAFATPKFHLLLKISVSCFCVAEVCGGVIGSNIPDFATFRRFKRARIGPWGLRLLPYGRWATIEHIAFWTGLLVIVVPFLFGHFDGAQRTE